MAADLTLPDRMGLVSVRFLRPATKTLMNESLQKKGQLVQTGDVFVKNDVTGLTEQLDFTSDHIESVQNQHGRSFQVFTELWYENYTHVKEPIMRELWSLLLGMGREDVVKKCRNNVLKDCELHIKDNHRRRHIPGGWAVNDERNVVHSFEYDVFISTDMDSKKDRTFVLEFLVPYLERNGATTFLLGRDDLPGEALHSMTAEVIEKKCKRVIIVLSSDFLKCPACEFQMHFTQALSPNAKQQRLIPLATEPNCIPSFLNFIAPVNLTTSDPIIRGWSLNSLVKVVMAPLPAAIADLPFDENINTRGLMAGVSNIQTRIPPESASALTCFNTAFTSPRTPMSVPTEPRSGDENSWQQFSPLPQCDDEKLASLGSPVAEFGALYLGGNIASQPASPTVTGANTASQPASPTVTGVNRASQPASPTVTGVNRASQPASLTVIEMNREPGLAIPAREYANMASQSASPTFSGVSREPEQVAPTPEGLNRESMLMSPTTAFSINRVPERELPIPEGVSGACQRVSPTVTCVKRNPERDRTHEQGSLATASIDVADFLDQLNIIGPPNQQEDSGNMLNESNLLVSTEQARGNIGQVRSTENKKKKREAVFV